MENCGIIRTYHTKNCQFDSCHCNYKDGKQLKCEYFQNNGIIEG